MLTHPPQSSQPSGKPPWLRVKAPQGVNVGEVKELLRDLHLNTVCEEASCPNLGECFANRTATFLIMGPACTRACPYCDIDFNKQTLPLDPTEPERVAEAIERLHLRHAVITSVNRDDLPDGGASQFVACIRSSRARMPLTTIEVLIPDLCGNWDALQTIVAAVPTVLNHNIETVPRLYRRVRPQARYERSLELLQRVHDLNPSIYTKSGIMLGLGESLEEVLEVMGDLRRVHCDIITVGQYLQPSPHHLQVQRYVTPVEFDHLRQQGEAMGFAQVVASPLTRSSYHAEAVQELMRIAPKVPPESEIVRD